MNRGVLVNDNNVIVNAIVVDEQYTAPEGLTFYTHETASLGWGFDGVSFLPPQEEVLPDPVPDLTVRQFMIALHLSGLITESEARDRNTIPLAIDAVFGTLPPSGAAAARITWAMMTSVPRNDPMVDALGPVFNKTAEEIDDFFRQAALI
jgi:hypothetical protein